LGISLTDQGKSRVFQSSWQADSNTTRKYGGTGLGSAALDRKLGAGRLRARSRRSPCSLSAIVLALQSAGE
jgi:signal transduction histidine kinase